MLLVVIFQVAIENLLVSVKVGVLCLSLQRSDMSIECLMLALQRSAMCKAKHPKAAVGRQMATL